MHQVKATRVARALALGIAVAMAGPAMASIDKNEALTACTTKAEETYGDGAITKLKRIKKRGDYTIQLFVSGVSDSRFVAECKVDKDTGEVTSIDPATAP